MREQFTERVDLAKREGPIDISSFFKNNLLHFLIIYLSKKVLS